MTASTYLEWEDQATGANNNTWGDAADDNFAILETAIARFLSIATTGGTTVLTSAQNRYPIIRVTGVLVSNAIIQVRTAEKNWTFINATTGAYTVTVKTSAGTGKTIPRGLAVRVYCDGTNVEHARYAMLPKAIAGGTADALTATFEPPTVSADLQDGYTWIVEAGSANATTTPTFNPDSTGALTIKKYGAQALVAGDIYGAGHKLILTYDASGGHVELLNPARGPAASLTNIGDVELATTTETLTGTDATRAVTPDSLAALWEAGADITDGAAITIGEGGYFNLITSTTAITSFVVTTSKVGRTFKCRFNTARTLTHNATSLILPSGANITTAQGDIAQFRDLGSGNVVCEWYTKADGTPLVAATGITYLGAITTTSGSSVSFGPLTLTNYKFLELVFNGVSHSGGGGSTWLIGNSTSDDVAFVDSNAVDGGTAYYGIVRIDLNTGIGTSILNGNGAASNAASFDSPLSTASTAISLAPGGAVNWDAGSVRVYALG